MERIIGNSDDMARFLGLDYTFDDWLDDNHDYVYEMYAAFVEQDAVEAYRYEGLNPDDFIDEIDEKVMEAVHEGEAELWRDFTNQMHSVANDLGTQLWLQFDHNAQTDTWTVDVDDNFDPVQAADALYALIMGIGLASYPNFEEFLDDWEPLEEELPKAAGYIKYIPEVYGDASIERRMEDWVG